MYRTSVDDKFDQEEMIRSAANEAEKKGIEKGIEKGKLPFVEFLLENTDFDDEKIASLAKVNLNRVKRTRTQMVIN